MSLISEETPASQPPPMQTTSIGVKLTLIAVGLLLFGFIVYSIISIRVGQGNILKTLEDNMREDASQTAAIIRTKLLEPRTVAVNLATAMENGEYGKEESLQILQSIILRNDQVFGATTGYEPFMFQPEVEYWAPYYNRAPDNTLLFNDLTEFNYIDQGWYVLPKQTGSPLLLGPYLAPTRGDTWIFTWIAPFADSSGNFRGVAAVDSEFSKIQEIFVQLKFGETGYAFLLDSKGTVLGIGDESTTIRPMLDSMSTISDSPIAKDWSTLVNNMVRGETGFMEATNETNDAMYIAYQPVGMNTGWSIAIVYPREEVYQRSNRLQSTLIGYGILLALVFGGIIFYFTRSITSPLRQLAKVAEEISTGNLQATADVDTLDEVGMLADSMNRMTLQLRDTLTNLERRITERTVDLEISRRQTEFRAAQLFAIGEISKIINSEQEMNTLLPLITRLVSERLNFYHTGIFFVDDAHLYAVLQAANSAGGQNMLKRGHKLKVGESGLVGYVAKSGSAHIALDVGKDAIYFNNPDLPDTRSEIALPLKVRDGIIGVLDVQSEKPGAFTQEDTNILSILADQVAIAIDNSRLFEQTQLALEEARTAYQQNLREGWKTFGQEEGVIGYYQSVGSGRKLTQPLDFDEINQTMYRGEVQVFHADGKTSEPTMVIPIKLREQIIGVIHVKAPTKDRLWTNSEVDLTEAVSERLSLALENARLIQESQRQVIKEQTIGEITTRISSSTNLENVLLTAVEELGRTIPGSEVTIKLKNERTESATDKEQP